MQKMLPLLDSILIPYHREHRDLRAMISTSGICLDSLGQHVDIFAILLLHRTPISQDSLILQVLEHRPEQPLSQCSVAMLIGVGKIVAAGRSRSTQARKQAAV